MVTQQGGAALQAAREARGCATVQAMRVVELAEKVIKAGSNLRRGGSMSVRACVSVGGKGMYACLRLCLCVCACKSVCARLRASDEGRKVEEERGTFQGASCMQPSALAHAAM